MCRSCVQEKGDIAALEAIWDVFLAVDDEPITDFMRRWVAVGLFV